MTIVDGLVQHLDDSAHLTYDVTVLSQPEVTMKQRSASELGALVRSSRVHRGLSQQQLALRAGLTREWLGRLEAGAPRLEMSKVLLAMNALDIRIETPDTFPTRDDVRRANQVARDMALESQNLTDETYQEVLRRMVDLRLSAESSTA